MIILDLNDSNLWFPVWELDVLAVSGSDGNTRIPEQSCPIILHKPVLAISANNPLGKPEWFSAGFLVQKIRSPLIVGGNFTTYVTSRRIALGQPQIVSFLDLQVSDYAVIFQPRYWHKRIQLVLWEYQGTVEET